MNVTSRLAKSASGRLSVPFERDVGLLLRDQIARAKLVERRAAAGRRRLHVDALDDVRRFVVHDNRARFDFFGKHGTEDTGFRIRGTGNDNPRPATSRVS